MKCYVAYVAWPKYTETEHDFTLFISPSPMPPIFRMPTQPATRSTRYPWTRLDMRLYGIN